MKIDRMRSCSIYIPAPVTLIFLRRRPLYTLYPLHHEANNTADARAYIVSVFYQTGGVVVVVGHRI